MGSKRKLADVPPMRDQEITHVDDELTEQARLASVLIGSLPPEPSRVDTPEAIRARLAPLDRIPSLAQSIDQLDADLQEPKTAFVLGFIDSVLPLETIIEVTGLPERDTLHILDQLVTRGAVIFPPRR